MKIVLALFLAAHGMLHASYLSPAPPRTAGGPEWPFELTRSWLVTGLQLDPGVVRALGTGLVTLTVVLMLLAGLATAGWVIPQGWWPGLTVAAAVASLATLLLFFHPWIVIGIAIDLVLLWVVMGAGWEPTGTGS
jgi:hypothetical protein